MTLQAFLATQLSGRSISQPTSRELAFSTPALPARMLMSSGTVTSSGRSILVNPTLAPVHIASDPAETIEPLGSAMLLDAEAVAPNPVIAMSLEPLDDAAALRDAPGWQSLAEITGHAQGTSHVPLHRSPKDRLGEFLAAPDRLAPSLTEQSGPIRWALSMNLWFAPAGTECLIHNIHGFLEYHVQIEGDGVMQKFRSENPSTLYHEQHLAPGGFHAIYPVHDQGRGQYRYPWHQYVAKTDCLWLAVEFTPLD